VRPARALRVEGPGRTGRKSLTSGHRTHPAGRMRLPLEPSRLLAGQCRPEPRSGSGGRRRRPVEDAGQAPSTVAWPRTPADTGCPKALAASAWVTTEQESNLPPATALGAAGATGVPDTGAEDGPLAGAVVADGVAGDEEHPASRKTAPTAIATPVPPIPGCMCSSTIEKGTGCQPRSWALRTLGVTDDSLQHVIGSGLAKARISAPIWALRSHSVLDESAQIMPVCCTG
jgi:hypothetical protein